MSETPKNEAATVPAKESVAVLTDIHSVPTSGALSTGAASLGTPRPTTVNATTSSLAGTLLAALQRVTADGTDKWKALCPCHDDHNPSLTIERTPNGTWLLKCHTCGADGSAVCEKLGLSQSIMFPARTPASNFGCTLAQYADAKGLDLPFLASCGVTDELRTSKKGNAYPAVRIPYRDVNGLEKAVQYRVRLHRESADKDGRFCWKTGSKVSMYGLDRLRAAEAAGYVVIVEGASDCHTLWQAGFHAVGLPGCGQWNESRDAKHFADIATVFVCLETTKPDGSEDPGGKAFYQAFSTSAIRDRIRFFSLGADKDPSGLYLRDRAGFKVNMQAALDGAVPFAEFKAPPEWTPGRRTITPARAGELIAAAVNAPSALSRVEVLPAETVPIIGTSQDPVELAKAGEPLSSTDAGAGERFAFYNRDRALYHAERGRWLVWDGRRWVDSQQHVERYAIETARRIRYEAAAVGRDKDKTAEALFKFALTCEDRRKINAMLAMAAAVPGVSKVQADFDTDPWLFNCTSGTVDLRTGTLRPHRRQDLLTKCSPVEYQPDARSAVFDAFIDYAVNGDAELRAYMQRAAGYSLTGDTREKCLFLIFSRATDTGKTTFLEALLCVLGDYGTTIDIDLLARDAKGHSSGPKYDLAKLAGVRFVSASESDRGKAFANELIKRVTGGDTIRARDCGEKSIVFLPVFKLWLALNDSPSLPDDDAATWNRMRRIPFDHQVPREKRDPAIKRALQNPGSPEARAFLSWAVAGCMEWQRQGLGTARCVETSTEAYREECDPLRDFFADRCTFEAAAWTGNAELRQAYQTWADAEGIGVKYRISPKTMASRLLAKNCRQVFKNRGRAWQGIALVSEGDATDATHAMAFWDKVPQDSQLAKPPPKQRDKCYEVLQAPVLPIPEPAAVEEEI